MNPDPVQTRNQSERGTRFRALHESDDVFLLPNPWDGGSARMLEQLGFPALATSSAAAAATLGRRDGRITRDEALAHVRQIIAVTNLPVSADLEHGFAVEPAAVAETIRLAAAAGLVGASIEDFGGPPGEPQFDLGLATERIAAAAEAARALPFPFTLTARAENYLRGNPNLDDTLRRLVAYERAGADVLFAPALPDLNAVREVCRVVRKPVNFMVGVRGKSFTVAEVAATGVKRISFGSSLYRTAMTGLLSAMREIQDTGTFGYLDESLTTPELNAYL